MGRNLGFERSVVSVDFVNTSCKQANGSFCMNQSHSGWRGDPWHRCDRCGQDTPVSKLRKVNTLFQGVLILCTVNDCIDKDIDRDRIKSFVLSQPTDELKPVPLLTNPPPPRTDLIGG